MPTESCSVFTSLVLKMHYLWNNNNNNNISLQFVWHMVSFISVKWLKHNTFVVPKDPITQHCNLHSIWSHNTYHNCVGSSMTHNTITFTVAVHWLVGKKGISNSVVALLLFHSPSHIRKQCFENLSTLLVINFCLSCSIKLYYQGF